MSSLQEQLMKAGLADKKRATQIKHEKRKKAKQQPKGHKAKDELKEQVAAEKQRKAEQDRLLNEQKQAELKVKEQRAMIKQMLEHHSVKEFKGDVAYNYIYQEKAKTLKVTAAIKDSLAQGTLAICAIDNNVYLMPDVIARRIHSIAPEVILVMHERGAEQVVDDDDPYADYQVPDDLMW